MAWRRVSDVLMITDEEHERVHGVTYLHMCPGCKYVHVINVEKPNHCNAVWRFDGNVNKPTFEPSVNIVGHCHYFITKGNIKFCSDSKHHLAGKTVPLPPIPDQ